MQSKLIFSCSLPARRRVSMASSSIDRSSSAPRSSSSDESGPANSTRISGRSQSRSSETGGSTVMRYFTLSPASFTMPPRKVLSWFADSILFIGSEPSGISRQPSGKASFDGGGFRFNIFGPKRQQSQPLKPASSDNALPDG